MRLNYLKKTPVTFETFRDEKLLATFMVVTLRDGFATLKNAFDFYGEVCDTLRNGLQYFETITTRLGHVASLSFNSITTFITRLFV